MTLVEREVGIERKRFGLIEPVPRVLEGEQLSFPALLTMKGAHQIRLGTLTRIQVDFNCLHSSHRLMSLELVQVQLRSFQSKLVWALSVSQRFPHLAAPAKFVVYCQKCEIVFQSQHLHDSRINSEGDRRVSLLNLGECASRYACPLSDSFRRIFPSEAREL